MRVEDQGKCEILTGLCSPNTALLPFSVGLMLCQHHRALGRAVVQQGGRKGVGRVDFAQFHKILPDEKRIQSQNFPNFAES